MTKRTVDMAGALADWLPLIAELGEQGITPNQAKAAADKPAVIAAIVAAFNPSLEVEAPTWTDDDIDKLATVIAQRPGFSEDNAPRYAAALKADRSWITDKIPNDRRRLSLHTRLRGGSYREAGEVIGITSETARRNISRDLAGIAGWINLGALA